MRSVLVAVLLASSLGACATVSMVSSEATVETGLTAEQSSLRKVSDAYIDLAERKHWVAKSGGLLGFARVLMDGSSDDDKDGAYAAELQSAAVTIEAQEARLREDIEGATHGLNVATMEAEKLFEADLPAKSLRADLVSYESALVTAKKARRTFVSTLAQLEIDGAAATTDALTAFDSSIDEARDAADKLADLAANRKDEATS